MRSYNISVIEVAHYFLSKINEEYGDCISNLKLQKLVYFAQGFVLAITGKTLFKNDIIAWQHGPVVRELYNEYKENGSSCITPPLEINITNILKHSDLIEILDDVYETYGQFSAWKLRELTHLPNTPWARVNINDTLRLEDMKEYFSTLVQV